MLEPDQLYRMIQESLDSGVIEITVDEMFKEFHTMIEEFYDN